MEGQKRTRTKISGVSCRRVLRLRPEKGGDPSGSGAGPTAGGSESSAESAGDRALDLTCRKSSTDRSGPKSRDGVCLAELATGDETAESKGAAVERVVADPDRSAPEFLEFTL